MPGYARACPRICNLVTWGVPKVIKPEAFARATAEGGKPTDYWDVSTPGLHLRVTPSGRRTWRLRHKVEGKPKIVTLGQHRTREQGGADGKKFLNVSQARTAARKVPGRVETGARPVEHGSGITVSQMIREVRALLEDGIAASSVRAYDATERLIKGHIGHDDAELLTC